MDPFGYKWMIMTHIEDVSYTEMQKRSDQMFSPK
jgi:PhnB protein